MRPRRCDAGVAQHRESDHELIWLVGAIVIIIAILSFLGLR